MRYRVVERKTYERSFVIEADDPEEVEEICRNEEYEDHGPAEYTGTEYKIIGIKEDN